MFEFADITLFQLFPTVLSTYNCDFVRGDVPAGQFLLLLGHEDMWQGMVLSHHFCQDREVLILVMVGCAMGRQPFASLSCSDLFPSLSHSPGGHSPHKHLREQEGG